MNRPKDIIDLIRSLKEQVWERSIDEIKELIKKANRPKKPSQSTDPDEINGMIEWNPENSPLKFSVSASQKEDIDHLCVIINELYMLKPSRLKKIRDSIINFGHRTSEPPYFEVLFDALENKKLILSPSESFGRTQE